MASPQLENGHIRIANEIVEALYKINLSAYESRLVWFILRKTYGWHKKTDRISYSQFEETGIDRRHISRTLYKLENRNFITISREGQYRWYSFQKDFSKWQLLPKEATVENYCLFRDKPLPKKATELLPKEATTKERKKLTKEKGRKQVSSSPEKNKQVRELFAVLKERRGYESPSSPLRPGQYVGC